MASGAYDLQQARPSVVARIKALINNDLKEICKAYNVAVSGNKSLLQTRCIESKSHSKKMNLVSAWWCTQTDSRSPLCHRRSGRSPTIRRFQLPGQQSWTGSPDADTPNRSWLYFETTRLSKQLGIKQLSEQSSIRRRNVSLASDHAQYDNPYPHI